jgi:Sigma-70 region 2
MHRITSRSGRPRSITGIHLLRCCGKPRSVLARRTGWSNDDLAQPGERRSRGSGRRICRRELLETFEEFYAREFPAVVGLAFALSGSRTASEDFAQEAFLAAHRDWARVAGYERPDLWVRRVVSNLSMSMFRRRYAEARALARSPFGPRTRCRSCLTMTQSSGRPSDPCGDGRRRSSRSVTWKTDRSPRSRRSSAPRRAR